MSCTKKYDSVKKYFRINLLSSSPQLLKLYLLDFLKLRFCSFASLYVNNGLIESNQVDYL